MNWPKLLLGCMITSAITGSALADSTSVTVSGAGSGDLTYFTQPNGTDFLIKLEINGASNYHAGQITLTQTHQYVGNTFVEIAPQALTDQFYTWPAAVRTVNLYELYMAYATTDTKRFGRFKLDITGYTESPLTQIDQQSYTYDVTAPLNFGGGSITPTDLDDQPVNQGSFWNTVLGPSEASLDRLNDCLNAFSTWGPLNIYSEFVDLLGTATTPDYEHVYLGFGTYDFRWLEDPLKACRLIMAISLWSSAIFWFWKTFLQKV